MSLETARIAIPEGFEIEDDAGTFRIRWKWSRVVALPLLLIAVAWDAQLISRYAGSLSRGEASPAMVPFPIPQLALGVVFSYIALAFLVNSTFIEVGQGELRVRHRPIPFPGTRTISVADVQQLLCVQRTGRRGTVFYDVVARIAPGRETKLVTGLATDREAPSSASRAAWA
jgi:hypothetical protein